MIDPDMGDELRVTVVATGLGRVVSERVVPVQGAVEKPKLVTPTPPKKGEVDYESLELPAIFRNQPQAERSLGLREGTTGASMDLLDVPAFLRRQAD